jgi:hypothetical protein
MLILTARLRERGLSQEAAEKEAFERIRKEG